MKKVIFSIILVGTIIVSGLLGVANEDGFASKKGDFGSAIHSLNILD
ncbi:hypothetical protein SAMN05421503_2639 [Terribacillus aidingensis]|uniref:Uncharacterized protein n=1 Tax=Terribacillus aidingensis TaxID=586416 RepID=A0A285P133_9BACI|nr:hypothetical protein [Terribacillus aidingensis]SNZ15454.1 hypothetical protein SAMN05421503_2639 [Terribacillus aidingensis]